MSNILTPSVFLGKGSNCTQNSNGNLCEGKIEDQWIAFIMSIKRY